MHFWHSGVFIESLPLQFCCWILQCAFWHKPFHFQIIFSLLCERLVTTLSSVVVGLNLLGRVLGLGAKLPAKLLFSQNTDTFQLSKMRGESSAACCTPRTESRAEQARNCHTQPTECRNPKTCLVLPSSSREIPMAFPLMKSEFASGCDSFWCPVEWITSRNQERIKSAVMLGW